MILSQQEDSKFFHILWRDWGSGPQKKREKRQKDSVDVKSSCADKVLAASMWSEKEAASPTACCVLKEQMMFSPSKHKYGHSWPFCWLGLVAFPYYAEITYWFLKQ